MFASIKNLVSMVCGKAKNRTARKSETRRRAYLNLETLAERINPSTFSVTTVSGTGVGSLPWAVKQAEHETHDKTEVIRFAPALAAKTIKTPATITLDDHAASIKIDASKAPGLSLDGGLKHSVFKVAAGTKVTMVGLTIKHGEAEHGAGIDNHGTLELEHTTVVQNKATLSAGGIENEVGASLTLDDSRISLNDARTGGGIDNHGTLRMSGTTRVDDNRADDNGGGVENEVEGKLSLDKSVVVNANTAKGYGGGISDDGTAEVHGHVSGNHSGKGKAADDVYEGHHGGGRKSDD